MNMELEEKQKRLAIFKEILKVIHEHTNLDGKITAEYLKKELLIEVFPEIDYELIESNEK